MLWSSFTEAESQRLTISLYWRKQFVQFDLLLQPVLNDSQTAPDVRAAEGQTRLQAADSGSFLKASKRMFISANAITKQINLLEERLGVKLFRRSPQGLELTDAGQLIYTEAKKLIRQSNAVLRKARELKGPREYVIHIGVSLMNPVNFLLEQWGRSTKPNRRICAVPALAGQGRPHGRSQRGPHVAGSRHSGLEKQLSDSKRKTRRSVSSFLVTQRGLEPRTFALKGRCSTN